MCDFCNSDVYDDRSENYDWEIITYFGYYPVISIDHTIDGGELGGKTFHTEFKINYCPICGRKLSDEDE